MQTKNSQGNQYAAIGASTSYTINGTTRSRVAVLGSESPKQRKLRKKMGIKYRLKQWLRNWIYEEDQIKKPLLTESTELESNAPMRITIHRAAGGLVVDTRTYDRLKDRHHQTLHIVTHDDDLSHSLSKIITMDSLRG